LYTKIQPDRNYYIVEAYLDWASRDTYNNALFSHLPRLKLNGTEILLGKRLRVRKGLWPYLRLIIKMILFIYYKVEAYLEWSIRGTLHYLPIFLIFRVV